MGQENFGSFLKENKELLKDYIDVRLKIFRLESIKMASKSAGYLVFVLVSLFLVFLIFLFAGLVLGFWLSAVFNSNTIGFGLTTLLLIVIFILVILLRNKLFIDPIIKTVISKAGDDEE
ncbi:MAG: hypothetical protein QM731_21035 [Chitinophagaceae bacterium]